MFKAILGKALYFKSVLRYVVLGLAVCALIYLVYLNPELKSEEVARVEHYALCVDGAQYIIHSEKAIILKKLDGKVVQCPKASMTTVYRIYLNENLYDLK